MPKSKMVCTLGPSSRSREVLAQLAEGGMNVVRLNFSHGTHDDHRQAIAWIREISEEQNRPIAILQDLSGPKIRVGDFKGGPVKLEEGERFTLTTREVDGDAQEVSITYPGLPADVAPGDTIMLSDGALSLEVLETSETDIVCRVVRGGPLSSRKGINVPACHLNVPGLTEKDKKDLVFGVREEVDYIALSFVRSAADVHEVRRLIEAEGASIPVIAKIEMKEALDHLPEILDAADGVMVARGDLGVEIPLESVPLVQKRVIDESNRRGKPVITGTQMMLSMVENPRPTRAEVTDVANAILDGTDAVMLTDETAIGKHPVEALTTMVRIALDVESGFPYELWTGRFDDDYQAPIPKAISHAACHLAEDIHAACICCFSQTGSTAMEIAKHRPACKILAPTPLLKSYRKMALYWAVRPVLIPSLSSTGEMVGMASALAKEYGLMHSGDRVVITAGVPVGVSGSTNSITSFTVE